MSSLLFDNIEIRNFRAFEYFTIEQLGHVNLIVGRNNVGKSTLLEALWLHANVGSPEIMREILVGRDEFTDHRSEGMKPAGIRGPAVWSLFHGHPCLERISETISIGRINAPDSSLRISVGWYQEGTGVEREADLVSVDGPDNSADGKDLIPALVIKLGSMQRVLRLDLDFEQHVRRWMLQPSLCVVWQRIAFTCDPTGWQQPRSSRCGDAWCSPICKRTLLNRSGSFPRKCRTSPSFRMRWAR
jgi:energy-coupling factor transporter ATP-binding protein EcfA2